MSIDVRTPGRNWASVREWPGLAARPQPTVFGGAGLLVVHARQDAVACHEIRLPGAVIIIA